LYYLLIFQIKDRLTAEFKLFMYNLLEPSPDRRPTFEQMYREPWFQLGDESEKIHYPSFSKTSTKVDQSRPSLFVSHPSYHNFTQDGVAIMNVDTDTVSYSRKLMQLPDESFINPAEKTDRKVKPSDENDIPLLTKSKQIISD